MWEGLFFFLPNMLRTKLGSSNSSDNNFIGGGLSGMSYSCRSYRKTIPNYKFIRGHFKLVFLKINLLQGVIFQNVLMDPKMSKEKQISLFFSMSFGVIVSFQKKLNLCVFPISYTCLHVISYKCEYVLFHLNMFCFI
jgi:hypothetical protein